MSWQILFNIIGALAILKFWIWTRAVKEDWKAMGEAWNAGARQHTYEMHKVRELIVASEKHELLKEFDRLRERMRA